MDEFKQIFINLLKKQNRFRVENTDALTVVEIAYKGSSGFLSIGVEYWKEHQDDALQFTCNYSAAGYSRFWRLSEDDLDDQLEQILAEIVMVLEPSRLYKELME